LFLKNILPGAVKGVPAKLCAAFLCILLNRLRFSPQNVGFGTKSAREKGVQESPQTFLNPENKNNSSAEYG